MTDVLFDKIADELIDNRTEVKRVSLYKGGEPLLDYRLPDRIEKLKIGGLKNVIISTNISLLSESKAREILNAGLDQIILSLDSINAAIYESIRAGLKFDQVFENTLKLIEIRNRIRPKARIWIRMIRQGKNWDEWPEYQRFWQKRLKPDDRINYHVIHNWGGQLKDFTAISASHQPMLPCVALWSHLAILANGDVPLCSIDYDNKFPNGNIMDKSISELWQSITIRNRRDKHLSGKKGNIRLCRECNAWDDPPDLENISKHYALNPPNK